MADYRRAEYLSQGDCIIVDGVKHRIAFVDLRENERTAIIWCQGVYPAPQFDFAYGELVQVEPYVISARIAEVEKASINWV